MGIIYDKIVNFNKKHSGGIVWRVKKHAKVVEDYINPDEEVLYAFCAQKNEKISESIFAEGSAHLSREKSSLSLSVSFCFFIVSETILSISG